MTSRISAALLVFCLSVAASACSCASLNRPCGAAHPHETEFVGKVLRMRIEFHETGPNIGFQRRIYALAVTESFSERLHPGEEVEIETGMGGGDCGYTFRIGEPYFVDAYTNNGRLSTGICSQTAPESQAEILISELRAALHHETLPALAGLVLQFEPGYQHPAVPLEGIPVTATSAEGQVFTASTDAHGIYRFASLLPSTYTMHFSVPPVLITQSGGKPQQITIPDEHGASPVCHASFYAFSGGKVTVHAVDRSGNPAPGFFAAYAWNPEGKRAFNWSAAGFSDAGAVYTLSPLSPGRYWIEFERKDTNKHTFFYPGTKTRSSAELVTVEEGKTQDIRLVLPD